MRNPWGEILGILGGASEHNQRTEKEERMIKKGDILMVMVY